MKTDPKVTWLMEQLATALTLLEALVDEHDHCRFDHDGHCQVHNLSESPCANALALNFIAEMRAVAGMPDAT